LLAALLSRLSAPDTAYDVDTTGEPVAAVGPPDCSGGITDDGDCCVTGVACGNACISAENECHVDDVERIVAERPTSTRSFDDAKGEGWQIFADHALSFYCGCPYTRPDPNRTGVPDLQACGYVPTDTYEARSRRIEWEHIVPAHRFGHYRECWQRENCVSDTGASLRPRDCCVHHDEEFHMMHSDLHNLVPAVGHVNAIRSNHPYGIVPNEPRAFGACDFEFEDNVAEPSEDIRGDVARVYLYFHAAYGMELSDEEEVRFEAWHEADPPDEWEQTRDERVFDVQGNRNPFVVDTL